MEATTEIPEVYLLKLYITGASPNSAKAVINIKKICEEFLKNRYKLEVIDIYQQPLLAAPEQIIALPLLIKSFPLPAKRLIGNMSDKDKVLKGLDLTEIV